MNKKLLLFFSLSFSIAISSVFSQGTGADGALTVDNTTTTINSQRSKVSCASGGGCFGSENVVGQKKVMVLSTAGFANNDLVLIINMTRTGSGQFEENTISSINAGTFTLTMSTNLQYTYIADSAQVIKIPQYTTVDIQNNGTLTCPAFDSTAMTGGILWFKANSTVTISSDSKIDVSGKGYNGGIAGVGAGIRTAGTGGAAGNGTTNGSQGVTVCGASGAAAGTNGARSGGKGGCAPSQGGAVGYLPVCPGCPSARATVGCAECEARNISVSTWSGTSGVSLYMGGGGQGGESSTVYAGGGGGGSGGATSAAGSAGSNSANGADGGAGGAGGGIVRINVNTLAGSGSIMANGADGGAGAAGAAGGAGGNGANGTAGGGGGAGGQGGNATCPGGGGAGGTVWITYTSSTFTGSVSRVGGSVGAYAAGGNGGNGGSGGNSTGGSGGRGGNGGNGGFDSNWSSGASVSADNSSVANSGTTGGSGGIGGTGQPVGTGGTHCFTTTITGAGGSGSFLPITLLSFTGKSLNRVNLLEWTTATELNNDHFEIESSKDAHSWSKIGTVIGAGNSSTFKSYQMSDEKPFEPLTYYRLKQVDYSGDFTYSSIIALNQQTNIVHHVINGENIDIVVNTVAPLKTEIVNALGQVIRFNYEESTGQGIYQVSTSGLPTGLYFLRVSIGNRVETIKFSK